MAMATVATTMVITIGIITTTLLAMIFTEWQSILPCMNDGSYRIYRNGQWKSLLIVTNNSSTNNLENDPHLSLRKWLPLLCIDNGDYYYYQNGKWVIGEDSADTTPAQPATPAEPKPEHHQPG